GEVYVNNATSQMVDIFEPLAAVTVPDVETGGTSDVNTTRATLHGTLDPDGGGDTTACHFEWGLTPSLGSSTPCTEGNVHPSAGGEAEVSAEIDGLLKGRQYHYRLVVGNGVGPAQAGHNGQFWAS